jgi:hypothetical protein
LNNYDESKKLIISRKIALSIQWGTISKYQSTRKYNSSLMSMIEEGRNNQGKSSHQEGHGLHVLINKGGLITLCHCSTVCCRLPIIFWRWSYLNKEIRKVNSLGDVDEMFHLGYGLLRTPKQVFKG